MEFSMRETVEIALDDRKVLGDLALPQQAKALIIFAHGSGSSRLSPRNQLVAHSLQSQSFGTLLFDLLSTEEDLNHANRFNISMLTKRLINVTEWVGLLNETKDLKLGYFGASTGAASALKAASYLPQIDAVVSRGGRPDLAMEDLSRVKAPTLLIVGSLDTEVIELNKEAFALIGGKKELSIVPGASHLFEEPGTMETVIDLSIEWFQRYL